VALHRQPASQSGEASCTPPVAVLVMTVAFEFARLHELILVNLLLPHVATTLCKRPTEKPRADSNSSESVFVVLDAAGPRHDTVAKPAFCVCVTQRVGFFFVGLSAHTCEGGAPRRRLSQ
jgi:hypothetical protein